MKVYVDGRLVSETEASVSPLDRGFTLGDGVFETLRLSRGRIFRLAAHLARLRRSAAAIQLPLPLEESGLAKALYRVVEENGLTAAVLRLTVSRGVPQARGLLPVGQPSSTLVIQPSPFAPPPIEKYEAGFKGITATIRRNEFSPTAFIKSCNYLDNVLARLEAAAVGADEGILLNTAGNIACGTSSNLFLIKAGELITPSLESGVLAGITRAAVLEVAASLGLRVRERSIGLVELVSSEESFLTNTVLGVMPLVSVDGEEIGTGKPGRWTQELREAYERLVDASEE